MSGKNEVPNPIASAEGDGADLPTRDRKLSQLDDGELPSVLPGVGDGPEVLYGKGVVLDMAGYHSQSKDQALTYDGSTSPIPSGSTMIATLTEDLNLSARILLEKSRPPLPHHSASEPPLYDDDDSSSDTGDADAKSEPDLSTLSLRDDRSSRATSEPPETPPRLSPVSTLSRGRPNSPHLIRTPNGTLFPSMLPQPAVMDLAWDWGGRPKVKQAARDGEIGSPPLVPIPDRVRSESMPIKQTRPAGRLQNVEENPFLFVLEMGEGRGHTFELSLCGSEGYSLKGEATVSLYFLHAVSS